MNFRHKVYLGTILGIFGWIWGILGYFGEFFSGIPVYHPPGRPWLISIVPPTKKIISSYTNVEAVIFNLIILHALIKLLSSSHPWAIKSYIKYECSLKSKFWYIPLRFLVIEVVPKPFVCLIRSKWWRQHMLLKLSRCHQGFNTWPEKSENFLVKRSIHVFEFTAIQFLKMEYLPNSRRHNKLS